MDALPQSNGGESANLPAARVYLDFYQLTEAPFTITPDPGFLFTAGSHQQAIEKITYAVESRMGFILLTGEVGTGKTTVCRALLDCLGQKAETVYIINPSVSGQELLAAILDDAHIAPSTEASKKTLIDHLHRHLLALDAACRPFVVIIDDAQTMPPETLEDLRLLSNLETDKHKLIQVVLSGQPELSGQLDKNELRQLKQRIAIHCRITPLSAEETDAYIAQRLFVAGNQGQVRFSADATRLVHKTSNGIPRLINKICDHSLTAGYVKDAPVIGAPHVHWALAELAGLDSVPAQKNRISFRLATAALAILLLAVAAMLVPVWRNTPVGRQPADALVSKVEKHAATPETSTDSPPAEQATTAPQTPRAEAAKTESTLLLNAKVSAPADPPAREKSIRPMDQEALTVLSSGAYALQLGSFSTLDNAQRCANQYRKKGIPSHWQPVNDGKWYRVVTGKFKTVATAKAYQQDFGIQGALIINAPLTVNVIPAHPDVTVTDMTDFLSQIGHDCLMETGPAGDNQFYTGLFASVEDASLVAQKINASDRFLARVVER